jgi:hypothetical protein
MRKIAEIIPENIKIFSMLYINVYGTNINI